MFRWTVKRSHFEMGMLCSYHHFSFCLSFLLDLIHLILKESAPQVMIYIIIQYNCQFIGEGMYMFRGNVDEITFDRLGSESFVYIQSMALVRRIVIVSGTMDVCSQIIEGITVNELICVSFFLFCKHFK